MRKYGIITFAAFFVAIGFYVMTGGKTLSDKGDWFINIADANVIKTSTATTYSDTFDIGTNNTFVWFSAYLEKQGGGDTMDVICTMYGKHGTYYFPVDLCTLSHGTIASRWALMNTDSNKLGACRKFYYKFVSKSAATGDTSKLTLNLMGH
jgi:hypothetical protein